MEDRLGCTRDNARLGTSVKRRQIKKKTPHYIAEVACRPYNYHNEEVLIERGKGINGLDYTSLRCEYRIVFAPKYRRIGIYVER